MISLVVPIYNEEEIIAILHDAVVSAMNQIDEPWEVVYVNDGSKDASLELLRGLQGIDGLNGRYRSEALQPVEHREVDGAGVATTCDGAQPPERPSLGIAISPPTTTAPRREPPERPGRDPSGRPKADRPHDRDQPVIDDEID